MFNIFILKYLLGVNSFNLGDTEVLASRWSDAKGASTIIFKVISIKYIFWDNKTYMQGCKENKQ